MYRQFFVREEDKAYQSIFWCDINGRLKKYQFNTVAFGLSAAFYLAIRCLKQLAQDEGQRFPKTAEILQWSFYVDDAITGVSAREEAFTLREELAQIFRTAGLKIREWASNDPYLLRDLPQDAINEKMYLGEHYSSRKFRTWRCNGWMGRIIVNERSLRMNAILFETPASQQHDLQSEHRHQSYKRDPAPFYDTSKGIWREYILLIHQWKGSPAAKPCSKI